MKNNTIAILAIAIASLLIVTAAMPAPALTNQALATRKHETASQSCVNQNARCQDLLGQIQGNDNAATLTGNQPTAGAGPIPPVIPNPFKNQGLCIAATEQALHDNLITIEQHADLKEKCKNGEAGQIQVAIALQAAGCENFCIPPNKP